MTTTTTKAVLLAVSIIWSLLDVGLLLQRGTAADKKRVHMMSSRAEHSEAEPAAALSTSGHMVDVLVP